MSALAIDVPFHGGTIPCLLDADDLAPYILLRPVCRELGLDFDVHHKRLRQQPWAVVATRAAAGFGTEDVVIDKVTFAMWLATVQPGRMRQAAARAKIELYQRDAARAVEHYLCAASPEAPTRQRPALTLALPAWELIGELVARQVNFERRLARCDGASAAGANGAATPGSGDSLEPRVQAENSPAA